MYEVNIIATIVRKRGRIMSAEFYNEESMRKWVKNCCEPLLFGDDFPQRLVIVRTFPSEVNKAGYARCSVSEANADEILADYA